MPGDEMIDGPSHKMARAIVARGRAAGMPAGTWECSLLPRASKWRTVVISGKIGR